MKRTKTGCYLSWLLFFIVLAVYGYTCLPSTGFWDSGEYLATSYRLQVGHPPGAPFYQLTARVISLLALGNPLDAAWMISLVSGISSAFTVFFLYHIIILLLHPSKSARNSVQPAWSGNLPYWIAFTGALSFAFTGSFWTISTETEVYALSQLFSAIIFWSALKFDRSDLSDNVWKWILLIAYLAGISAGVHQLSLLALPASLLVVGRKWISMHSGITGSETSSRKAKVRNAMILAGFIIIPAGFSILFLPILLAYLAGMELFSVNSLGFPFFSGLIAGCSAVVIILTGLLALSHKMRYRKLNLAVLSVIFFVLGYSSYLIIPVRAASNVNINISSPDDIFGFKSYVNRDIYQKAPLLYGPYYTAPVTRTTAMNTRYTKDFTKGQYVPVLTSKKTEIIYDERFYTVFPRMWNTEQGSIARGYQNWGGVTGKPVIDQNTGDTLTKPRFIENLRYFFRYQLGNMYFRYLLWNFAGRQNDRQHLGGILDGNWITGLPVIDRLLYGPQHNIPSHHSGQGQYFYFLIPLFLGLTGFLYSFRINTFYAWALTVFFVCYSLAIVIYVNQDFPQARERDYSYTGSFMIFTIWISMAALQLINRATRKTKRAGIAVIILIGALVAVPFQEFVKGWYSQNRHYQVFAVEYARAVLDLCNHGTVLFTYGDNDTYPLWYIQEVENYRPDVKVININLLSDPNYQKQAERKTAGSAGIIVPDNFRAFSERSIQQLIAGNQKTRPVCFSHFFSRQQFEVLNGQITDLGLVYTLPDDLNRDTSLFPEMEKLFTTFIANGRLTSMINDTYLDQNMRETAIIIRDLLIMTAKVYLENNGNDKAEKIVSDLLQAFPVKRFGPSVMYSQLSDIMMELKMPQQASSLRITNISLAKQTLNYYSGFTGWQEKFISEDREAARLLLQQLENN